VPAAQAVPADRRGLQARAAYTEDCQGRRAHPLRQLIQLKLDALPSMALATRQRRTG
jgi:hypothetical protein